MKNNTYVTSGEAPELYRRTVLSYVVVNYDGPTHLLHLRSSQRFQSYHPTLEIITI